MDAKSEYILYLNKMLTFRVKNMKGSSENKMPCQHQPPFYLLNSNNEAVQFNGSPIEWALKFEATENPLWETDIEDNSKVVTVFSGFDMNFGNYEEGEEADPDFEGVGCFETVLYINGKYEETLQRYGNYADAKNGHDVWSEKDEDFD